MLIDIFYLGFVEDRLSIKLVILVCTVYITVPDSNELLTFYCLNNLKRCNIRDQRVYLGPHFDTYGIDHCSQLLGKKLISGAT